MSSTGFVSLVGAGPGDIELITVKGLRRLQQADVVLYDALSSPQLLEECRPDALLIAVGKRSGKISASQSAINQLLVAHGQAGRRVVRLKGGDPFVFGRGGEEAEALTAAGIPWEVVPGISSAIGVPAYAGIPVTHREAASSVTIVTGHEDPSRMETRMNWHALAQGADTLVFLMGLGSIAEIAAHLIAHGRPTDTPAAVISHGTTAAQQVVVGSLENIADAVQQAGVSTPAAIVVGEVVRLRERLAWFAAEHGIQPAPAAEPLAVARGQR
ncbi:uroporphyrinogen-III C-methyltransferase [Chloroflexia bacterium SDU3-3]|nr:uroporphyrinogen-III C-methyltransferase [Chloroflexia bacterium SDU3-3]